jgi:phosphopantothenoylcysteine decarboxylase/phosphopantothenate--cysteine ligase
VRNPDIVSAVAQLQPKPFTVGFAAETQNVGDYARDKLERKNLDMIVANNVAQPGIGFNSDNNAVTALWRDGEMQIGERSKMLIARELLVLIDRQMHLQIA